MMHRYVTNLRVTTSLVLFCAAMAIVLILSLAEELKTSQGLIKLRNSLIFETGYMPFDWHPSQPPDNFVQETLSPTVFFAERSGSILKNPELDTVKRALMLATHLQTANVRVSGAIQAPAEPTYREILKGKGYCGDFTQVFMALALASDISVREWGMSFDGYGGDGHAFNEIFSAQRQKWIFVDSFNSFYVTSNNEPLSYTEFRSLLLDGKTDKIHVVRLSPNFPFKSDETVLDYYLNGADQSYLWMANDVYSYDAKTSWLSALPSSLEQLVAIAMGIHQKFYINLNFSDTDAVEQLNSIRLRLFLLALLGPVFAIAVVTLMVQWSRRRRAGS